MKFLNRLERKFGKYAISNLIRYIVFAYAAVYLLFMFDPTFINNLVFIPSKVFQGEVWRVVTFLFVPPTTTRFVIFFIFALYVAYLIGTSLEQKWGSFKFNLYYFIGAIGTIIGAFITGVSLDNTYLVLSLFLAFATLFPDFTFMIFFVLPVKVKYLGYFSAAMYLLTLITGTNAVRVAILVALINYFLFFGKDLIMGRKNATKARIRKKSYQTNMSPKRENQHQHQCEICGKTDQQDFNLEFRRCSKCEGQHEYCMEHLFTHEHIKK